MGRFFKTRLVTAMVILAGLLLIIQGFGSYLVERLSQFESASPIINEPLETQVVKRKTLRLDTMSYYMLQVGVFNDSAAGQPIVDALAALGYRVYTTDQAPYHLWLGCVSDSEGLADYPAEIADIGQDIYVAQGLVNAAALSFNDDALFVAQRIVPIVEKSDVLLKHGLKMFQTYHYADYSEPIWQEQFDRLGGEIDALTADIEQALLEEESEALAMPLVDLETTLEEFKQSLAVVAEKRNDRAVLLAQSYLLQLINQYHQLILAATDNGS